MGIYEFNSVSKNFEEVATDLKKLEQIVQDKIKRLEDSTGIKKVQYLKNTCLSKTTVNVREDSSWYSKLKYIIMSIPEQFYNNLDDKNSLLKFKENTKYSYDTVAFKIAISESNTENFKEFKKIIDVIYQFDTNTHNENLRIVEENKKLSNAIFNLLEQAGIRTSYYDYKTSRSSKKTEISYNFPSEIRGQIPIHYSKDSLDTRKKQLLEQLDKYWDAEMNKIRGERLKKEREQMEKEQNRKLALLLAKYDLDLDCEWTDILDAIIEKDKYLRLAHYLEKNRGDWSSGCDYAETGLEGFSIETETDQAIYDDIQGYINTWENHMDGRVFRDCEYNYSVLFGMVEDVKLMSDYETVKGNIDEY